MSGFLKRLLFCLCLCMTVALHAQPSVLRQSDDRIVLACVDCYSSMALLHKFAREKYPHTKIQWILIQTHDYDPVQAKEIATYPSDSMHLRVDPNIAANWDRLADHLRELNVAKVFRGMDVGARYAAELNHRLRNSSQPLMFLDNDVATAELRRDKVEQAKVIGDLAIPTHVLEDANEALQWMKQFPHSHFVIKYAKGAFGNGLETLAANDPALKEILQSKIDGSHENRFQEKDRLILSPKIRGPKYFLNTFSYLGKHYLTAASEYMMLDTRPYPIMYFMNGYLDLNDPVTRELASLVEKTYPKWGMIYGEGHPEFIYDLDAQVWRVLEHNARAGGAGTPPLDREVYGISQLDLSLMEVLDPAQFHIELANLSKRKRLKSGFMMILPAPGSGSLNPRAVQHIKNLDAYFLPASQYEIGGDVRFVASDSQTPRLGIWFFTGNLKEVRAALNSTIGHYKRNLLIPDNVCENSMSNTNEFMQRRKQFSDDMSEILMNINWQKF